MSNIIDLDDMRPHISALDAVDNTAHVIPVDLVRNIAVGKVAVSDCDESMVRALMSMLLEEIAE